MELRSGTPFWSVTPHSPPNFPPLAADRRCEVVVLGGGVTGALAAHALVGEGKSVVLLDRRQIGAGSTAASTGLLQYEIDTPLSRLIKQVGQDHAVHAYRRGLRAIDEIEQLTDQLDDRCGFARRDSLYFASSWWHMRRLKREYECRRQFRFDVEFMGRAELAKVSSIRAPGAIISRGDAQIDPYRFTHALIQAAVRRGLVVHANTQAEKIEELQSGVLVHTAQGVVKAERIIFATGYESGPHLDKPKADLNSTYALVSQAEFCVPGWPDEWLIWETARPYFYARRTSDGRAMIGGADTEFATDHQRDAVLADRVERLEARFRELFPAAELVPEYTWAGTFAETKDGLAYIGQRAQRPRAYFALGYGGNGITFSMIAAKLLADLIAGRPNPDAEVFRFGR